MTGVRIPPSPPSLSTANPQRVARDRSVLTENSSSRYSKFVVLALLSLCSLFGGASAWAQTKQLVIIDTDIGDYIDDAYALALALRSPEFQILGITTTSGDTNLRAKLAERYLAEAGRSNIPVSAGVPAPPKGTFTQRAYAERGHFEPAAHPKAADFILAQIRKHPGEITLLCLGPLVNEGAMIDQDPRTFRKLKRVVMMGGSIRRGYDTDTSTHRPPEPEWNIANDIPSTQKLFRFGVPIYLMPLDATQLNLNKNMQQFLLAQPSPIAKILKALTTEWGNQTPIMYDPLTVAYALKPSLCPVTPMHIHVDDRGFTRSEPGEPNAHVCLASNADAFFRFYLERVAPSHPHN